MTATTKPKTRGIPFSGWKAKWVAGLEVGAEFQTRRIVKASNSTVLGQGVTGKNPMWANLDWLEVCVDSGPHLLHPFPSQYLHVKWVDPEHPEDGQLYRVRSLNEVGDRLYSREAFAYVGSLDPGPLVYRASYPGGVPSSCENVPKADEIRWTAGMFQPKALSRGLFEILSVKVERVQDISEEDVIAEGIGPTAFVGVPVLGFREAWDEMYAKQPEKQWDANPWVWAYTLKKLANGIEDG